MTTTPGTPTLSQSLVLIVLGLSASLCFHFMGANIQTTVVPFTVAVVFLVYLRLPTDTDRKWNLMCQGRPTLSDVDFCNLYYPSSREYWPLIVDVRRSCEFAIGVSLSRLQPTDHLVHIFEVDIRDLLWRIERDLQLELTKEIKGRIEGDFSSIVEAFVVVKQQRRVRGGSLHSTMSPPEIGP